MSDGISEMKAALRKEFFQTWRNFSSNVEHLNSARAQIQKNLLEWLGSLNRHVTIMGYDSFPSEVPVMTFLNDQRCRFLVPLMRGDDLIPVDAGTKEEVSCEKIDYVIVPGLFLDQQGFRLGRGKGFYDRFLIQIPAEKRMFVGHSWQIRQSLPVEKHDQQIHFWITETGISGLVSDAHPHI